MQVLIEDVINGLLKGLVAGKVATQTISVLPLAYKAASELEPAGGGSANMEVPGIKIDISRTQSVSAVVSGMSEELLDKFLKASPDDKARILEHLKGEAIVAEPKQIALDVKEISRITKLTPTPLSKKRIVKLFGRNLARQGADNLVSTAPEFIGHDYERVFKKGVLPDTIIRRFKCRRCGLAYPTKKEEPCLKE